MYVITHSLGGIQRCMKQLLPERTMSDKYIAHRAFVRFEQKRTPMHSRRRNRSAEWTSIQKHSCTNIWQANVKKAVAVCSTIRTYMIRCTLVTHRHTHTQTYVHMQKAMYTYVRMTCNDGVFSFHSLKYNHSTVQWREERYRKI